MKKVAVSIHAIENFTPNILDDLTGLDFLHVDVMDGEFVETNAYNLAIFKILKNSYDLPIIAHLMVKDPIGLIEKLIENIDIFVFHYESIGNIELIIDRVKSFNKKVGIAINPDTKLEKILLFLNKIDLILVMSVFPGKSGQKFIWEVLDKLNLLIVYRQHNKLEFLIDIDGGINLENAKLIHSDILTSASSILRAKDPNLIIQALKNG